MISPIDGGSGISFLKSKMVEKDSKTSEKKEEGSESTTTKTEEVRSSNIEASRIDDFVSAQRILTELLNQMDNQNSFEAQSPIPSENILDLIV
ncbi:MAG: hypothetical protein V1872_04960 [bacterium]